MILHWKFGKKNTGPQGLVAYRHRRPKTIFISIGQYTAESRLYSFMKLEITAS